MASAALSCASAVHAQPTRAVRLGDLRGMDAEAVQMRLGGARAPPRAGLSALTPRGSMETASLAEFGDSAAPDEACHVEVSPESSAPALDPMLVFERGQLVEAVRPRPARSGPIPNFVLQPKAFTGYMRAPLSNPAVAAAGELPLQHGAEALVEASEPLPDETLLVRRCAPRPQRFVPRPPAPGHQPYTDTAGALQGLALLPFAVALPGLNAERRRAREEGPRTLSELHLGDRLAGGAAGFAKRHRGVFEESRGDYSVLVINMGAMESNNLSRMNAAAFAGVRAGRVEWIVPSGAWPSVLVGLGLCEDDRRRPSARRRGCTDYGFFSP